ncbi:MAG: VIT family protein [Bordetella sp.]|nr:MAG: VIT family protein [Bordetella sp.]
MLLENHHRIFRAGWLRAAVLGANDGIVSTASLITGVAGAQVSHEAVITSGLAGLVAGALSMAGGEYVSVCSQSDTEAADLKIERDSLNNNFDEELIELAQIYIDRGLSSDLAYKVANELTNHDALDAHARDELGISIYNRAQPIQAAVVSSTSFAIGGFLPLFIAWVSSINKIISFVMTSSVIFLAILGILSAWIGGAPILPATARITILGIIAMVVTTGVGFLFGIVP